MDLRVAGVILGIYERDTAYRNIECLGLTGEISGIDYRLTLDMARNTGTVYALFVVVVVMRRRRENEEGDGDYPAPTLESQPVLSHVGELSTTWKSCQAASTSSSFLCIYVVYTRHDPYLLKLT